MKRIITILSLCIAAVSCKENKNCVEFSDDNTQNALAASKQKVSAMLGADNANDSLYNYSYSDTDSVYTLRYFLKYNGVSSNIYTRIKQSDCGATSPENWTVLEQFVNTGD